MIFVDKINTAIVYCTASILMKNIGKNKTSTKKDNLSWLADLHGSYEHFEGKFLLLKKSQYAMQKAFHLCQSEDQIRISNLQKFYPTEV